MAQFERASLPYSVLVHAYSDLHFRPSLLQSSYEPGALVQLRVAIDQYDTPLDSPTTVWAEIQSPDKSGTMLILNRTSAGRFSASFTASDIGVYTARVRAKGVTLEGQNFQREQRLTAAVFIGGNQTTPRPGGDRLCQLLQCLLGEKVIGPEFERELAARGLNLKGLLDCMNKHCRESEGTLGGENAYVPHSVLLGPGRSVVLEELRNALFAIEQQAATAPDRFADLVKGEPVVKPKLEPMIPNFGADLIRVGKRPSKKPPAKKPAGKKPPMKPMPGHGRGRK